MGHYPHCPNRRGQELVWIDALVVPFTRFSFEMTAERHKALIAISSATCSEVCQVSKEGAPEQKS